MAYDKFMVEFIRLFIKCCPLRENCMKQNEIPKKPWLSRGLVNACHKKNYLYTPLTRFNKIAIQGTPQMAVDKEAICLSRVYSYYPKCNFPLFYV